tara:strand:+ start:261 stop:602 length:342 start_codon:yes stop_codon:yes gene_type:complete
MTRKQSKKKGLIKRKKSRVSHGRNSTRVNRKQIAIFNKFIDYLKTKKGNYKSMKDVYDCVTNTKNRNYSVVKNDIIDFIKREQLDLKPEDFNTSNNIEESLLDFIPFDCKNES